MIFRVERDRAAFLDALRARGVLMVAYPHGTIRAVTHYGVTPNDIETVLSAAAAALRETTYQPAPDGRRGGSDQHPEPRLTEFPLTRPAPAPLPAPSTSVSTTWSRAASGASCATTPRGHQLRHPCLGRPAGRRQPGGRAGRAGRRQGAFAAIEALDPAALSPEARFERELELHHLRESIFETDVIRTWERRSFALDALGDALFLLMARDFAPLADRLQSIAGRLEGVPAFLAEHRTRAAVPQVRVWQRLEIEEAGHLRRLPGRDRGRGPRPRWPAPEQRRLDRAILLAAPRHRGVRRLAARHPGERHRQLGAGQRAPRRADRVARRSTA